MTASRGSSRSEIGAQRGWSIVTDKRNGATGIISVMAAKQGAGERPDVRSRLDYELRGDTAEGFAEFIMHDIMRSERLAETWRLTQEASAAISSRASH